MLKAELLLRALSFTNDGGSEVLKMELQPVLAAADDSTLLDTLSSLIEAVEFLQVTYIP